MFLKQKLSKQKKSKKTPNNEKLKINQKKILHIVN